MWWESILQNERVLIVHSGAFPIWRSYKDCCEVLDWARLHSGLLLNYHRCHHQCFLSSLASTWVRPLLCWRQQWRAGKTGSLTPKRVTWWTMLNTPVEVLFILFHHYFISFSGLGVFWLIFLPALGIYYTIRTRHTVTKPLAIWWPIDFIWGWC